MCVGKKNQLADVAESVMTVKYAWWCSGIQKVLIAISTVTDHKKGCYSCNEMAVSQLATSIVYL